MPFHFCRSFLSMIKRLTSEEEMPHLSLVTLIEGERMLDICVPLSENMTEAEAFADRVLGLAKNFDEAVGICRSRILEYTEWYMTWTGPGRKEEWLKTKSSQHWTMTWHHSEGASFLEISHKDGEEQLFLRRRSFVH